MAYKLTLTEEDIDTIAFVGTRYSWSSALLPLHAGENELTEAEAWEIAEAFMEDDTQFPMISPGSELYTKLLLFATSVV